MKRHASPGFWVTNHVANPILRALLMSRAGRRFGRSIAVLDYSGRRTGHHHTVVAQYARDGHEVWVVPAHADQKTWWRNFGELRDVDLRLAGEDVHGRAIALDGREHPDEVRRGLTVYLQALPRARKSLGLPDGARAESNADLVDAASRTVIVRIALEAASDGADAQ
jgi:hypothetical protein